MIINQITNLLSSTCKTCSKCAIFQNWLRFVSLTLLKFVQWYFGTSPDLSGSFIIPMFFYYTMFPCVPSHTDTAFSSLVKPRASLRDLATLSGARS
jgi:hypothetical protein